MKTTLAVEPDAFPPTEPTELIEHAWRLVREFPGCFTFWHPEARLRHREDVRLVVEHLREYGGWRAWRAAQELHRCLLPRSSATP
jgi:hypothetical protein